MRKHYTTAQRAELTSLVATGRVSPRGAAARLGVPESTAYYWLRSERRRAPAAPAPGRPRPKARPADLRVAQPPFARLVRAADSASPLTLRVGAVTLEVRPGFDATLLREVVAALLEATP